MNKVYIDLFDDGHHFEHALHIINYYHSESFTKDFVFFICVTDKLTDRLLKAKKQEDDCFPIFIKLNTVQNIFIKISNKVKNSRIKIFINNLLYIYTITLINIKYKNNIFILNGFNNLNLAISFLNIFFRNIRLSGIYFNPLYRSKFSNLYKKNKKQYLSRKIDKLRLYLLRESKIVHRIYFLCDSGLAEYYNRQFKTNKFINLSDPFYSLFNILDSTDTLRNDTKIIKILFFGALQERKGLILCLESILKVDHQILDNFHFTFLGKIDSKDQKRFYELLNEINKYGKAKYLTINDSFIEYRDLINFIKDCNIIYTGYESFGASSGVLSWAASFRKPVICIKNSLISENAKFCGLDFEMNDYTVQSLINLLKILPEKYKSFSFNKENIDEFLIFNSPFNFAKELLAS